MRLVVDTSTIVRGLLKQHTEPAYIVDQIANNSYQLLMTDEMAKELMITIYLLSQKNNESDKNTKKYLRAISTFILSAEKIETTTVFNSCSDVKDKMFIECAIDGQAKYCVPSDYSLYDL